MVPHCGFDLHFSDNATPVFLPGESHGQRSLAGYSPWGHKETDTTEQLTLSFFHFLEEGRSVVSFQNIMAFYLNKYNFFSK